MDVRNLLQLQRAFHRDRVHGAAAEEQRVMLVGEALCQFLDDRIELERRFDQGRYAEQSLHQSPLAFSIGVAKFRQGDHEHAERRELRRERLCRRNANFRTGARQHHEFRFAHQRTFGHVADGELRKIPALLRHAQRRERVGCFTRLRHADEQCVLRHHGIAIAVFARNFNPARQAADLLDEVMRDHAA